MKIPGISRLLYLALGLTVFTTSENMVRAADTNDPVVSAIHVEYNTSNAVTNGYPYQSKQKFSGASTLDWTLGQASSATSGSLVIQSSWSYPVGWTAWSTNGAGSVTSWPATGGTGTVTTTSFILNPMMNSSNTTSGVAAAYVPPTSDWQYAFGDVQVTTGPNHTNKTATTASAVLQLQTNGGTSYGSSSLFRITASASERAMVVTTNWVNPYYYYLTTNIGSRPIPPGNINCGLGTFGANGVLYTNLNNNASYTVTPTLPAQYTNYTFNLSAQRVLIHIGMRTDGPITLYTTNASLNGMVGPFYYTTLTNYMGSTNLGLGPVTQPLTGKRISNLAEFSAGVPNDPIFDSGWLWHRDGNGIEEYWRTDGTNTTNLATLSPTNGPIGSDDPIATGFPDLTTTSPDAARVLYDHDAPALRTKDIDYLSAPVGSVFAKRFNARQWLTWNGVVVSDICYWHTQVTIKKTTGDPSWVRVGPNEIGLGLLPSIGFTASEASQY